MSQVKIKRLALNSYIELCGIVGFSTGIIYSLFGIILSILSVFGANISAYNNTMLQIVTAPFTYGFSGILLGAFTYKPYKLIMRYKKRYGARL